MVVTTSMNGMILPRIFLVTTSLEMVSDLSLTKVFSKMFLLTEIS